MTVITLTKIIADGQSLIKALTACLRYHVSISIENKEVVLDGKRANIEHITPLVRKARDDVLRLFERLDSASGVMRLDQIAKQLGMPVPCPVCLEGFASYLDANNELYFYGRQPNDEQLDEMCRHGDAIDTYLEDVQDSEQHLQPELASLIRETLKIVDSTEEEIAECMWFARDQSTEESMAEWHALFAKYSGGKHEHD